MPNQKGGKKFKRGGKKNNHIETKLIYKDPKEDQEYAKITKVNGSGRYQMKCFDGTDRLGICAGNIKRKFRFSIDDIVLVALWDFQDSKCSIIHKYEPDEAIKLKNDGEFPDSIQLNQENDFNDDDYNPFTFDYSNDNHEDKKSDKENNKENNKEEDEEEDDYQQIDFIDI